MAKKIRRIIMILLLCVFLFAAYNVVSILLQYKKGQNIYKKAVSHYVQEDPESVEELSEEEDADGGLLEEEADGTKKVKAPITVDFEALQEVNPDVIGWIYCKGTNLNYPVLKGETNDTYLRHTYDGAYNIAGSIFIDSECSADFSDPNTIIYGHNMQDKSMFSKLEKWSTDGYVEEHPVIWLLTPDQDYKIRVFSGYTTSAYSDTYVLFSGACQELTDYIETSRELSDFQVDVDLDPEQDHYVLLSTCAYVFDNARYVLHGRLEAVDSAGGKLQK